MKEKLLKIKGVLLAGTLGISTLSGCSEQAVCEVNTSHIHMYVDDDGFITYFNDEHLNIEEFNRSADYVLIDDSQVELYNFIKMNRLIPIEDNIETIKNIEENNQDYLEYRYSYIYTIPIVHRVGKVTYTTLMPTIGYSWTTNPEHSRLTGDTRICHYKYYGIHVYKNEKGKYVKEYSNYVDSIDDLDSRFTYIERGFYKIVNLANDLELDYEDGPEEEHRTIDDEDYLETSKLNTNKVKKYEMV